jgi:hypothetical protein
LKRTTNHIIRGWLLLFCFAAGQYLVWSHQHTVQSNPTSAHRQIPQPKQVLTENCQLCDALHHNYMAINTQVHITPVIATHYAYKQPSYSFTSTSLVLSPGRSPPMA